MNNINVALLVPTKNSSHHIDELPFFKVFLPSFLETKCDHYTYTIYLGVDKDDPVIGLMASIEQALLKHKISCKFTIYDDSVKSGHLTKMWNILFTSAHKDNNDYFYQCGDDINFSHKGWLSHSIDSLNNSFNIGAAGPIQTRKNKILTQTLVHKTHMDIFGYYFPESIQNWLCDDWINNVYKSYDLLYMLQNHEIQNMGGEERYPPQKDWAIYNHELKKGKLALSNHIKNRIFPKLKPQTYKIKLNRYKCLLKDFINQLQSDIHFFKTSIKNKLKQLLK